MELNLHLRQEIIDDPSSIISMSFVSNQVKPAVLTCRFALKEGGKHRQNAVSHTRSSCGSINSKDALRGSEGTRLRTCAN